jgi:hypothetical protein
MIKVQNIRKSNKPPRICTFEVHFESECGPVQIRDCSYWNKSEGNEWVSMPSKAFDGEGGKKKYFDLVRVEGPDFGKACLEAIKKELERASASNSNRNDPLSDY